jgi:hypothetical protein
LFDIYETDMDIRSKIESLILDDECLPDAIVNTAKSKSNRSDRKDISSRIHDRSHELNSIKNVLIDTRSTWKAKEDLAASVLKGENDYFMTKANSSFSLTEVPSNSNIAASNDKIQQSLNLVAAMGSQHRFDSRKHAFFELTSQKLNLEALSIRRNQSSQSQSSPSHETLPSDSRRTEPRRQIFVWGRQSLEAVPLHHAGPASRAGFARALGEDSGELVLQQRNRASAAYRLEAVQKHRMEMDELKRASERIVIAEKEAFEAKLKVKKCARDFRKVLLFLLFPPHFIMFIILSFQSCC